MADPQGTTLFQAYERMCSAVPGHACACPDLGAGCPLQLDQGASSQQAGLCACGRTKGPGARRCGSCHQVTAGRSS